MPGGVEFYFAEQFMEEVQGGGEFLKVGMAVSVGLADEGREISGPFVGRGHGVDFVVVQQGFS